MGVAHRTNAVPHDVTAPAPGGLSPFQIAVAELFFSLPESNGFLLTGGAALVAQNLIARTTEDLDLFTRTGRGDVRNTSTAFERAARTRGWTVRRMVDRESFCRLVVSADAEVLVDIAVDSPPILPPQHSTAGPTFGLEELAGRKVVALFDRAEARDFADVHALARRFGTELLLARASEIDPGFDEAIFAEMLGH